MGDYDGRRVDGQYVIGRHEEPWALRHVDDEAKGLTLRLPHDRPHFVSLWQFGQVAQVLGVEIEPALIRAVLGCCRH